MPQSAIDAGQITDHVHRGHAPAPWPAALDPILSPADLAAAAAEIAHWPGYAPTPLHPLDGLASALDLGAVLYKDEGPRFGLDSFKALGGAYAVLCSVRDALAAEGSETIALADLREGRQAERAAGLTIVTATDGNHGRAVAWGCRLAGCACRIYVHAEVSEGRCAAMAALGATVVRVDGDYDESLKRCVEEAEENGWLLVSDTSFEGYLDVPRRVMAGYGLIVREALEQAAGEPFSHVFVQAGVGGLAGAVCAGLWQALGEDLPRIVVVEPARAACIVESFRQDRPSAVAIEDETIMAGLSCGEISLLAWEILSRGGSDAIAIDEDGIVPAMRLLASGDAGDGPVVAGETAVSGLVGLNAAARDESWRTRLGLTANSRVLLIGTEGASDPAIYRALVPDGPLSG